MNEYPHETETGGERITHPGTPRFFLSPLQVGLAYLQRTIVHLPSQGKKKANDSSLTWPSPLLAESASCAWGTCTSTRPLYECLRLFAIPKRDRNNNSYWNLKDRSKRDTHDRNRSSSEREAILGTVGDIFNGQSTEPMLDAVEPGTF